MSAPLGQQSPALAPRSSRPTRATRRAGYVAAVVVNAAMLYLANRWPGWEAVPFLTEATVLVIGLVNASLVVGVIANLVYLVADPPRLRSLGDLVTTSVGLAAIVRIWQVFPFDVTGTPWEAVLRVLLALAAFGSGVGIIVALVGLVRGRRAGV
ncbi:hypothetical protein [Humibacillus xanthopallidus]|uniref:hypothetical protein n=1 Tax=Humibacillus xanthopallidus TaxID=412689 RepID=UPI00384BCD00